MPIDENNKKSMLAYMLADREFHFNTLKYAKNDEIFVAMNKLGFFNRAYLLRKPIRPPELTLPEHRNIIAAYCRRDGHTACELMMAHFFVARDLFVHKDPGIK
jgi:DNA-binding GntR family transcriptional regulator